MRLPFAYSLNVLAVLMLCVTLGCGADQGSMGTSGGGSSADSGSTEEENGGESAGGESEETGESAEAEAEASESPEAAADTGASPEAEAAASEAADGDWGNLIVRFEYGGDPPAREKITPTGQDAAYCSKEDILAKELIVNPDNKGVANIVGWLTVGRGEEPPAPHPSNAEAVKEPVVLDNLNCQFVPHMLFVQTGQTLVIKNSDEVGHNAKANLLKNRDKSFSDNLPAGQELEYTFDKAESLPMIVECTVHPWMKARMFVIDHPFFGKSDENGQLVIPNLPVGKFTIRFNHEKAGNLRDVAIGEGTTDRRGEIEIEIKPGDNDLGVITLDPATFE